MSSPGSTSSPDRADEAALLDRIAAGDREAAVDLLDQHVDAVHDHVARWSRDARLAATATVTACRRLLADVRAGRAVTRPRAQMIRTARAEVVRRLEEGVPDAPLSDAVLSASRPDVAATGAAATNPTTAAAVWAAVAELDDGVFTCLDLTARHRLDAAGLRTALELPEGEVAALLERTRAAAAMLPTPVKAYTALAWLRAPVPVRQAIATAVDDLVAPPPAPIRRGLVGAALALGLAAIVGMLGLAASEPGDVPLGGPATAAAVPVSPSPTPEPTASPTPSPVATLAARPTTEPIPTPSPLPTPSPSPSPSPSPPATTPLTVTVDAPASGTSAEATEEDGAGRPAARIPVLATVSGGDGTSSVVWTSDLAPDESLLSSPEGSVLLWLQDACLDTAHTLTVTATDEAGTSATASVDVLALETCAEPVGVTITSPGDGAAVTATRDGEVHRVTLDVAAEATDADVLWTWTSDRDPGAVLLDQQAGTVRITIEDCTDTDLVLRVDVERPQDGSTASDAVQLTVACVG